MQLVSLRYSSLKARVVSLVLDCLADRNAIEVVNDLPAGEESRGASQTCVETVAKSQAADHWRRLSISSAIVRHAGVSASTI